MDATQPGVRRLTNLTTGGPVHVDVEDGRIRRIVPLQLDETDAPSWTIDARGRSFTPPRKTTLSPWTVAHRSTIYAPNRILTPLKRVDWDPNGERNTHKRGESGYEPISWDEALDLVAAEIVRIKREVGPAGMLTTPGSHHLWGNIGYRFSAYNRFMNLVGFTYGEHNPDSWEGWQWGGAHMWGFAHRLGIPEQYDLLEDALKHTEMMVFWSSDPETTAACTARSRAPHAASGSRSSASRCTSSTPTTAPPRSCSPTSGWRRARAPTWRSDSRSRIRGWGGAPTTRSTSPPHHGFDEWQDYVWANQTAKSPRPRDGPSRSPASLLARSRRLPRSGRARRPCSAPARPEAWAAPAGPPPATSGPAPWWRWPPCRAWGKPGSNIWSTTGGAPIDCDFFFPGILGGRHLRRFWQRAGLTSREGASTRCSPRAAIWPTRTVRPRGRSATRPRIPEMDAPRVLRVVRQGIHRIAHRGPVP